MLGTSRTSRKKGGKIMPEVSRIDAARIIGTSRETIRRFVNDGTLPARREGRTKAMWIDVGALRKLAIEYQYRFNDELANQLAK